MRIVPALSHHLNDLSDLARATFSETFGHLYPPRDLAAFLDQSYAPQTLAVALSDPAQLWQLVVDDHDHLIAYLHCGPVSLPHPDADPARHGEIKRIYVRHSHQGHGLGKTLMRLAMDELSARYGEAPQWIGVYCDNLKAQGLYAAYGFTRVGGYQFPVGDTLDDEFILRCDPVASA